MSLDPKKDGSPNLKFFDSPKILEQFNYVNQWLLKNAKQYIQTDPPTNKSLSTLVVQILQFQENNRGKNVAKPQMMKIPMESFLDFVPGGKVCQILLSAFKFKQEQGWRHFDFPVRMSRAQTGQMLTMLTAIDIELKENEMKKEIKKFTQCFESANRTTSELKIEVGELQEKHEEWSSKNQSCVKNCQDMSLKVAIARERVDNLLNKRMELKTGILQMRYFHLNGNPKGFVAPDGTVQWSKNQKRKHKKLLAQGYEKMKRGIEEEENKIKKIRLLINRNK